MKLSKKKGYRVINNKPCGERSPYWEWLLRTAPLDEEGLPKELPEANPDVLPESAHMFALNLNEEDQTKLDAIMNAWDSLSTRERQAIEWYGHEGKTLDQVAKLMHVSLSGVRCYLNRASRKIKKAYKMLQD